LKIAADDRGQSLSRKAKQIFKLKIFSLSLLFHAAHGRAKQFFKTFFNSTVPIPAWQCKAKALTEKLGTEHLPARRCIADQIKGC
jgi:hypothetical protein